MLAERALVQMQPAKDDGARVAQALNRGRIRFADEVLVGERSEGRRDSARVKKVLDSDRNAMQGSPTAAGPQFSLGLLGFSHRAFRRSRRDTREATDRRRRCVRAYGA